MYAPGDSDITINNYLVYIRTHQTAETIDSVQRLRALVWDFETISVALIADTGLTISGNAGQGGSIYGIDATASDVAINLANYPGDSEAPVPGDVIVFYVVNVDHAVTVIDETSDTAITTTLDRVGEAVALEYVGAKWIYWGMINNDGTQIQEYTNIGRCEEKPFIKTATEITKNLDNGNEKDVAESLEYGAKDLQVNGGNRTFLKTTLAGANVDIIYYCKSGNTVYPTRTVRIPDVPLKAFLEVTGNEVNAVNVTSKKTCSDVVDVFDIGLDA